MTLYFPLLVLKVWPDLHLLCQETREWRYSELVKCRVIATVSNKYGEVRKQKIVNDKLSEDLVANCPPHTWVVNDALHNYRLEGGLSDRRIVHENGDQAKVDMGYYAKQLDKALDISWVRLSNGRLVHTQEFNLGGE